MRYVVTGAAGFIGSNLTYELVRQGKDVLGIDFQSNQSQQNRVVRGLLHL